MAVGEYLRAAAGQLRRAAIAAKSEADDIRRDIVLREQDVNKTIDSLRRNMQQRGQELFRIEGNDSSGLKADITGAIAAMEQEIKTLQQSFERERQQMLRVAQQKETTMNNLNSQANSFENQAG